VTFLDVCWSCGHYLFPYTEYIRVKLAMSSKKKKLSRTATIPL